MKGYIKYTLIEKQQVSVCLRKYYAHDGFYERVSWTAQRDWKLFINIDKDVLEISLCPC